MPDRPPILYKYLNAEGAEAFLKQPQIRFKDWRVLDDLMEMIPGSRLMTDEEISTHARGRFEQLNGKISEEKCQIIVRELNKLSLSGYWEREMRTLFAEAPALLYVSSMSERCDSGAMWALYAQEHRGIVFGISAAIDRLRGPVAFLNEVTYAEARPQMPFPMLNKTVLSQTITTKSTDWAYQREWRLVADKAHIEILLPGEVTEVVVGYKATTDMEKLAISLKAHGTKVFRARPDPQKHAITRDEL